MVRLTEAVEKLSGIVWGPPMLILLVGTGVYLTFLLRGLQFTSLLPSLHLALIKRRDKDCEGDISHFQALMTALAATVGTGNIAGVATAIATGGPGAMFWMWMTGLFGMATKYAEALLAVKYRTTDKRGMMCGGPMYYISDGLGWKWLGVLFAIFATVASFGIGNMVQSNSVCEAVNGTFGVPHAATGVVLTVATGLVLVGGIRSIGRVTSLLVPVMIVFYFLAALYIIISDFSTASEVFRLIFKEAFTPTAASGGFAGATVKTTIQMGVARGVFSNESGLGSSAIAAAAAQTRHPVRQAMVSMTQTFIDTIVVCSLTGLVILMTGVWDSGETGARLTQQAFNVNLPGELGGIIVSIGMILFAYSTIIGWSYYGEKSLEYLLGERSVVPYRLIFTGMVFVGAISRLDFVWLVSDVMNALMAVPNLVGLLLLSGVVYKVTRSYFKAKAEGELF
ncbi:MAG TPA: sodium:alanine symporter family protein [Candidatus Glassbacteria bacterium]|nr:sodium:alanine symporter family protein [Candidatus Glassbacteria bacterium]